MAGNLKDFVSKAKTSLGQAKVHVKETFFEITGTPSMTIQQLADYIQHHPETNSTTKTFFGQEYSFYELKREGNKYHMETRGSRILQLDANSFGEHIVSYRSYRDSYPLNTPIKLLE
jgi:hypothetical protein